MSELVVLTAAVSVVGELPLKRGLLAPYFTDKAPEAVGLRVMFTRQIGHAPKYRTRL